MLDNLTSPNFSSLASLKQQFEKAFFLLSLTSGTQVFHLYTPSRPQWAQPLVLNGSQVSSAPFSKFFVKTKKECYCFDPLVITCWINKGSAPPSLPSPGTVSLFGCHGAGPISL